MAVYDFVRNQLVTSLGQDFPPPGLMFFLDEWQKHRTEKEPRLRPADMRDVVERALACTSGPVCPSRPEACPPWCGSAESTSHVQGSHHRAGTARLTRVSLCWSIFKSLEDVPAYRLPEPYQCHRLPPGYSECLFRHGQPPQISGHTSSQNRQSCPSFGNGVEIVSWNSTPIDEAVHLNTEFEEGSNEPHDLALALQFMTVRWLGASYEPDSPWVFVAFKTPDGRTLGKFLWSTFRSERWTGSSSPSPGAIVFGISSEASQRERAVHAPQVIPNWRKKSSPPRNPMTGPHRRN